MQTLLNAGEDQTSWVVVAGNKRFGPFVSSQAASVALQTGQIMVSEQERMAAQIVPITKDGREILLG